MNRIQSLFAANRAAHKPTYVAYLTMGAPTLHDSFSAAETLLHEGADILELGVPFSNPVLDGPIIRKASSLALANGTTLANILVAIPALRAAHPSTPLVLFSYYSPIHKYGLEKFAATAAHAGIDAILVPDLPDEKRNELLHILRPHDLTLVPLITPTMDASLIQKSAADIDDSFLYAMTMKGLTGQHLTPSTELSSRLEAIKKLIPLPVVAGFGIRTPEEGARIATHCDGFVIGSALVKRFMNHTANPTAHSQYK